MQVLASDIALKRVAKVGDRLLVNPAHLCQCRERVVEAEWGDERRAEH
jgi:hypothetical protein